MDNCDKLKKNAKYSSMLMISIFLITILHQSVDKNAFITFIAITYVISAGIGGIVLGIPYFKCLFDYNNSRKPPHLRKR